MAMGRVDQLSGFRQTEFCRNESPMFYEQVSTEVDAFVLQAETEVVASWPRSPTACGCHHCLSDGNKPHHECAAIAREVHTSATVSIIFEGSLQFCHTAFSEKGMAALLSHGKPQGQTVWGGLAAYAQADTIAALYCAVRLQCEVVASVDLTPD